jgi:hypothetical protein
VALRGDDGDAFCDAVNDHLQWSITLARESVTLYPETGSGPPGRP